jgi:hypothetical protein
MVFGWLPSVPFISLTSAAIVSVNDAPGLAAAKKSTLEASSYSVNNL